MPTVRALVVGSLLLVALAVGSPAHAGSVGVEAAPGRQYLNMEGPTTVYVANVGDKALTINAFPVVSTGEADGWVRTKDLALADTSFQLKPHSQASTEVAIRQKPNALCTLYGVGFEASMNDTGSIRIEGVVVAQLVLKGAKGTEDDCLAVIPAPPAPPVIAGAGAPPFWWFTPLALLPLGVWFLVGWKRRRKDDKSRARGF